MMFKVHDIKLINDPFRISSGARPRNTGVGLIARLPTAGFTRTRAAPPCRVAMPAILIAINRGIGRLVDPHEAGIIRVATRYGVIFNLAEIARERDVLGATDVLIAEDGEQARLQQHADNLSQLAMNRQRRARSRRKSQGSQEEAVVRRQAQNRSSVYLRVRRVRF
jgi:hypothetical protein